MLTILRNSSALLKGTFYLDEVATNSSEAVTATVYRDNGSVLATGIASEVATGIYSYQLDPQADLDILTVTWAGVFNDATQTIVTEVAIVDSYFASVAEIRALDSLSDTSKYSLATVSEARAHAETLFEHYCNRAFVPRYARVVLDGSGLDYCYLPHNQIRRLINVTEDDVELDTSEWIIYEDGKLYRPNDAFSTNAKQNVSITYEHGYAYVPTDIKRAFLTFVRYLLLEAYNKIPDRTLNYNADGMFVQMAQAGPNRPTGLPEVDAVLNRYRAPKAGFVGGWGE